MPLTLPPEAASRSPLPHPVSTGERALLVDVLRGLALLGILIVNVQDFAGFRVWTQTGLDRGIQVITDILLNGRAISLFAMLFGWGVAGMLARQGRATVIRRLGVLLVIGTLHFLLVWRGDIITSYALLALALLFTVRMTAPALLLLAGVLGGFWLWGTFQMALAFQDSARARFSDLPSLSSGLGYSEIVMTRAASFLDDLPGGSMWLITLFLLGAAAQRVGLLTRPGAHLPLLRRLAVGGLGVGLPLGGLLAWFNTQDTFVAGLLAVPIRMGGGLAAALGYVGVLGLLAAQGKLGRLEVFAASGRVALSNYIAQSLLMTAFFYPYGGGYFGQWGAGYAVLLALIVGLGQVPVSAWMLARFGGGPLERLTRVLVYGRK